jgi:hypothetical protein
MNKKFYGLRDFDEAKRRNEQMTMVIELAANIIGDQPHSTINDDDMEMYRALKRYSDNLQKRF